MNCSPVARRARRPGPISRLTSRSLLRTAWRILAFVLLAGRADALPERADFLIVENVKALRMYDIYQQPVHDPAHAGISPFTPFKIVAWKSTMSDGFTPCTRVQFRGRFYALLRDPETMRLIGDDRLGFTLTVRDAVEIDDTVLVRSIRRLGLRPPRGSTPLALTPGDQLIRLFRQGSQTYVLTNGSFGWITFPTDAAGVDWAVIHGSTRTQSLSPTDALSRIRTGVEGVNRTLQRLYGFLDSRTGTHRTAPRWEVERMNGSFICLLRSTLAPEMHAGSTAQLAKNIESRFLGTGYSVRQSPGRITISP